MSRYATYMITRGEKGFGVMGMPYRKKPCLAIKEGNVCTKVASFNDEQSAEIFMDFVADFFKVKRQDEP